ncbi:MAG: Rieske (2Fe-2S) iron-sulfur domain protein [Frankiales bacterium]|jgi:ubiquinol-cytochrome c reductase iron-sulfur subunit|nr:Rieske (2Fe-2S) iron-sulfur domain protein [Frankiales bacterium]
MSSNTGGQQPSPPTGQTSAEAAGSIRDRLAARPTDEASSGGDSRTSDVNESAFQQTYSVPADEQQRASSSTPQAVEALGGEMHRDLTPQESRSAERKVSALFLLSVVGVIGFIVTYVAVPSEFGEAGNTYYTPLLGSFMALALFGVGAGAVLWAKLLMPDEEAVQERHPFGSPPEERAATAAALKEGFGQANIARRPLLIGSLALGGGALALLPVPLLFSMGPYQHKERVLRTTGWKEGVRLIRQNGTPVKLGDLVVGAVESVFPDVEHGTKLADSPALLIRMRPEELDVPEDKAEWVYDGHIVYSSICTHLGCPVKLYEQQTHHLFCPCHQSTFDASKSAKVLFGPAARPLPQLAISVDEEGYFVAQGDFQEPTGPSYWERG